MWRKSGLRQKILIGYFILVAVIATVGAWSIYNIQQLNKVLTDITRENYISVLAASNMIGALERQDSGVLLLLLKERQQGLAIYQAGRQNFMHWFDQEEQNITLPNEGELVSSIKNNYSKYNHLQESLDAVIASGDEGAAHKLYHTDIYPVFSAIRADLQKVLEINHQEFMAGNDRSSSTAHQAALSVAGAAGSAVCFGIIFALALSLAVVRPVIHLTETVRRIQEGNLSETVTVISHDELGELAREFNSMLLRLRAYENVLYGKLALEQQKALAIIQAMAEGIILVEQNQRIIMLNPAAEQIFDLKSDAVVGKPIEQILHQLEIARLLVQAGHTDRTSFDRSVAITVAGQERCYEIEVAPFRVGEEYGNAIILKDVTYFKLMDKKKTDFLSAIAHEIRTPLTSITMGLGILNENNAVKENKSVLELLAIIQEESSRLTTLMDEFLELSRFEAGGIQLKIQQLDVANLLERAIAPFRMQASKAQIQFETSLSTDIPLVKWDADKIHSVIANLLTNALRYTPPGGKIFLGVQHTSGTVLFSVADTGPGVPLELRNKIFDKFFQIETGLTGKIGLGLAICKAIVKKHGGKIWVANNERQGASFFVELPIQSKSNK
jgi:PAS domain S-box-containing protein